MRKEVVPFLLLIVIVGLAYSIWFFQAQITDAQPLNLQNKLAYYQNLTSTLQTRVSNLEAQLRDLQYNVTIVAVSSTPWTPLVGVAMDKGFYITVKNNGVRDIGGFTIGFKMLTDGNLTDYDDISLVEPDQIGVLHVQESTVLTAQAFSNVGVSFGGKSVVITLMLDEIVLDERTVPLSD